jgi:arginyl-tRNA synthetase
VRYLTRLAADFHSFYTACRIRGAEEGVLEARLKLSDTTREVFKNGLGLMRITAPESM